MTTVWFIRHGESEANIGLPTIDPAQVSLTSRGRKQAEQIAQAFAHPPSIIVVSSFLRAKQTAEPLISRYPQVQCIRDELMSEFKLVVREFTYLSLSKQKKTTKQERKPLVDAYWERLDPDYVAGAGAESFVQFIDRVSQAITWLKERKEEFIAVFSHEQFILAALWFLKNTHRRIDSIYMRQFHSFLKTNPLPNGAIVQIQFSVNDDQRVPPISIQKEHLSS